MAVPAANWQFTMGPHPCVAATGPITATSSALLTMPSAPTVHTAAVKLVMKSVTAGEHVRDRRDGQELRPADQLERELVFEGAAAG